MQARRVKPVALDLLLLYDRVIANPPFSLDEWGFEQEFYIAQ